MLKQIEQIVDKVRRDYPIIGNELDGKIYYMNGNDGTDFDWDCNGRLCEFMVFHENEFGYIKIMVDEDKTIDVYVYRDGGKCTDKLEDYYMGDVVAFKDYMFSKFDENGLWDESIDEFIER